MRWFAVICMLTAVSCSFSTKGLQPGAFTDARPSSDGSVSDGKPTQRKDIGELIKDGPIKWDGAKGPDLKIDAIADINITCPGACPACNKEALECSYTCTNLSCPPCPAGWNCTISVQDSGRKADCAAGQNCTINCMVPGTCDNDIICGAGDCEVSCGDNSCSTVQCGNAANCIVNCSGKDSCQGTITCGANSCQTHCTGAGDACNGTIDCSKVKANQRCEFNCTAGECKANVNCGAGGCSVECDGRCSGNINCENSCECNIQCDTFRGNSTCPGTSDVKCPTGCSCDPPPPGGCAQFQLCQTVGSNCTCK